MGKIGFRMITDISFDRFPRAALSADALASCAYGQMPAEGICERFFKALLQLCPFLLRSSPLVDDTVGIESKQDKKETDEGAHPKFVDVLRDQFLKKGSVPKHLGMDKGFDYPKDKCKDYPDTSHGIVAHAVFSR
jgi:hypothetical protein